MESKLLALIPLLGWFYISLFALVVVRYLFPKIFSHIEKFIWFGVGIWAFVLAMSSLLHEVSLYSISKGQIGKTAEQKIADEIGSTYSIYYKTFHPYMKKGVHINVVGVSTKEHYYARMYLYPAPIENHIDCDVRMSKGCIIHVSQSNRFLHYRFVDQKEDKVLLMKE